MSNMIWKEVRDLISGAELSSLFLFIKQRIKIKNATKWTFSPKALQKYNKIYWRESNFKNIKQYSIYKNEHFS